MKSLLCLAAIPLLSSPAWAGSDHDLVRRAVEDGRILPLTDILARAETAYPGQLIEAELEDDHGRPTYEIKMLSNDGRVMKLLYDARTGDILKSKEKERRR